MQVEYTTAEGNWNRDKILGHQTTYDTPEEKQRKMCKAKNEEKNGGDAVYILLTPIFLHGVRMQKETTNREDNLGNGQLTNRL